jgi:hypothetical protein
MDDSDQEIKAVKTVWPNARIRLCFWHLTEAWRRWLCSNVDTKALQLTVSNALRCMAHAGTPAELTALWVALQSRLRASELDRVRLRMLNIVAYLVSSCLTVIFFYVC